MKKATWLFSSVIAALLTTGAPAVVSAADVGPGTQGDNLNSSATPGFAITADENGTGKADSTAEVVVNPGKLSLLKVPDLNFGTVDVKQLITDAKTLELVDGTVISKGTSYDGSADQKITVEDYRGSNNGWNLTASLDKFTGPEDIIPTSLSLKGNIDGTNLTDTFDISNIVGTEPTVIAASAATGAGSTTATLTGATLVLPKDTTPKAGTYQAKVVWTLSSVAPTTSPEDSDTTNSN